MTTERYSFRPFFAICLAVLLLALCGARLAAQSSRVEGSRGELLPTGIRITPTAAKGSRWERLNPELPGYPGFEAGQAVTTAVSPDGNTLLILTSGYNRNNDARGRRDPSASNEYVFVYDISVHPPEKRQVLQFPNTFCGLAWNPRGHEFYVAGGVDDTVHIVEMEGGRWSERRAPIALGHAEGLGPSVRAVAGGLAVNAAGTRLLVTNFENDSVSEIDLERGVRIAELDLRPGKSDAKQTGVPGGEYPFWVAIKGNEKAYVSSPRDREVVVLDITAGPKVLRRIPVKGQPNKMLLNWAQSLLYVALGNTDSVAVVDTGTDRVAEEVPATAPESVFANPKRWNGSNPNSLALSPDERTLYVTNGGSNSVAVIEIAHSSKRGPSHAKSRVIGLIPTGWYPNSVSLNRDGSKLYVVNGKSNAGPNLGGCRNTTSTEPGTLNRCNVANQFIWQLTRAGFLTMPRPSPSELSKLTRQVARNNGFRRGAGRAADERPMSLLRGQIKHVIYVVKENRSYDQVLGDLERGNGDPALTLLPEPLSPNHHQVARQFVTVDNFFDSGEVSGDGWNWSTAARTMDVTEKTVPLNYANRGLPFDWEGSNRGINVGFATLPERLVTNPDTPDDPDILPGTADVAAPDGPGGEAGAGYLWDAALRAGLTVRNYGFFLDLSRNALPADHPAALPPIREAFAAGKILAYPTKAALRNITDPYFSGFDLRLPDYWRFKEWEREFDEYVKSGSFPNLELVRLPHDHFGNFATAIDGVNTVETQMADNDYALGLMVEKVSRSIYKDDTLIFIIEDDAQNGADHVDAHRSIAFVAGPFVRRGAVVSKHYTTVNMLRTIEDILGIQPLGLLDGLASPMADVFHLTRVPWTYSAIVPDILRKTQLPLPPKTSATNRPASAGEGLAEEGPLRDSAYWEEKMRGLNFNVEDDLDTLRFNRALWEGRMGEGTPYPTTRHGRDLSQNRQRLLKELRKSKASPAKDTRTRP